MNNTWYVLECTVVNRGTSDRRAIKYRIACPAGRVFANSQDESRVFDKPSAVAFVQRQLTAGDEVLTFHRVNGQTYREPVRVREGKIASTEAKTAWLQTISNGIWNDNLYSLPDVK